MKRINYGEVSYLVGDDVANLIVQYTARLSTGRQADAIEINVLGPDGNLETSTFALGPGITMAAETTRSELEEPDNSAAIEHMTKAISQMGPGVAAPMTADDASSIAHAFSPDEDYGPDQ